MHGVAQDTGSGVKRLKSKKKMWRRTAQRRIRKRWHNLRSLSLRAMRNGWVGKGRNNVGRRNYGGKESKDNAARKRRSVRRFAVRSKLSQLGEGMERLWRAEAEAKRKIGFRGQENRGREASSGVVCWCQQVSMYEMRKRQSVHKKCKEMPRSKVLVENFKKMEKATFGRPRYGQKNGHAGWSSDLDREWDWH